MKQKVLLIGGTGTISTPIALQLDNDPAVDLHILNRGKKKSHDPAVDLANNVFQNAAFITADAHNFQSLQIAVAHLHFDVVINFVIYSPENARQNIDIFRGKTKQFIFISTVAALNHEYSCNVDENMPYGNRFSLYGQNKATCEQVFLKAYSEESFPVTIVRPTQTYSENRIPLSVKGKECWPVVQRMIDGKEVIVHGDGQTVWASTHARDFTRGFLPLIGNREAIGQIYQIMNTKPHTFDMVYQILAKELGVDYKPAYIPSDVLAHSHQYDLMTTIQGDKRASNIFDCSKLQTIIPDFKCEIDIEEGLKEYLAYMDEHPQLKVEEPEFDEWCDRVIAQYKQAMQGLIESI
ncbi:MAG TPA: NAD-dependent dehydratase [Anaerolineaceae bacterium]|nr:NAD-dependent dehydratase [Anaerolineaceae bacterium]